MASWQDGPEYAPIEAPDRFTVPDAAPLDDAPPPPQLPYAPAERPQFGGPTQPVAPLATLDPERGTDERDPRTPFAVDSSTMTDGGTHGGAWGAAHWRPPAEQAANPPGPWGPPGPSGAWGPPTGAPVDPSAPLTPRSGAGTQPGNLPAPGTPQWFGPGPQYHTPQRPPSLFKATPPGAIIVLCVSIIFVFAPVTFVLALLLSLRARYAKRPIMIAYAVVSAVILLITISSTLANYGGFGYWYDTSRGWFLIASLLMIVLTLVFVNNDLKQHPGPPRGSGSGGNGSGGAGPGGGYQNYPPGPGTNYPPTGYPPQSNYPPPPGS